MKKISILLAIIIAGSSFLNLKADSPRKVLYEKFTNASCPPCAAQNPVYKNYLKNPANKAVLIPITYHVNYPGSDIINQLNNLIPSTRRTFYNAGGVPNGYANGILPKNSGNAYDGAIADTVGMENTIRQFRGQISPIDITITQVNKGTNIEATVQVVSSQQTEGVKVYIAFVERYFPHPNAGSNGQTEFEFVVRDMVVDGNQSAQGKIVNLVPNQPITINEEWTVPGQANPDQIYIVAFVQNTTTKEVLQAGTNLKETPSLVLSYDSKYSIIDRNSTTPKKISFTNPSSEFITVNLNVENNKSTFNSVLDANLPTSFTLNGNETKEIDLNLNNGTKGGFSNIVFSYTSIGNGIPVPERKEFGFLSKGTKYVVYTGFPGFVQSAYAGVTTNPDYMNETAFLPIADENEYFPTEKVFLPESFDVTIMALGNYPLVINNNPHNIAALAQTILDAGKHVYISSTDGMYYTFNPTGAGQVGNPPTSLEFYTNKLGLQYINNVARNNGQSYTQFTINGVMNDPIGKELSLTANINGALRGSAYTDVFSLTTNSRSIPCFYYNNVSNDIAGVRYRNPSNNARLVYTSFTMESLGSKTLRDATMKNIMDWLVNDSPTSVATTVETGVSLMPNPASIFSTINFQSTSNQAVTISVVDVQGKVVLMNEISAPTIGSNSYSLMTSKLTNGSYTVVVKQGENVSRTPLVVMN